MAFQIFVFRLAIPGSRIGRAFPVAAPSMAVAEARLRTALAQQFAHPDALSFTFDHVA